MPGLFAIHHAMHVAPTPGKLGYGISDWVRCYLPLSLISVRDFYTWFYVGKFVPESEFSKKSVENETKYIFNKSYNVSIYNLTCSCSV